MRRPNHLDAQPRPTHGPRWPEMTNTEAIPDSYGAPVTDLARLVIDFDHCPSGHQMKMAPPTFLRRGGAGKQIRFNRIVLSV